ncbi:MAG: coproporphyrinogen III oxidase family protein [Spirochaetes bacterium]|nr:coproporphyrinogen III oxidase family protein [Spirochaetota bacterium]
MFFDPGPKSLYIHIPFCKKKCSYCDFFSIACDTDVPDTRSGLRAFGAATGMSQKSAACGAEGSFIDNILEETVNQIIYFKNLLSIDLIDTIYIGGGTPSAIDEKRLEEFIQTVALMYNEPKEFSIEVNPETVTLGLLEMLNRTPVTRISLGVQSFNQKMLDTLGRNCTAESVYNALELLKNSSLARFTRGIAPLSTSSLGHVQALLARDSRLFGRCPCKHVPFGFGFDATLAPFGNKKLSIDLISSIPGQTVEEALADVTTALSFKPEHISLYYLTLEEGTPMHRKFTEEDQDDKCWVEACELLKSSGYDHYEISNFCLPGNECLHNAGYWKMEPYIGCGLSAVSTFYSEGSFWRFSATDNPALFLEGEKSLWGMKKEIISNRDFLIELLMMGLRTKEGVNIREIGDFFNIDIEKTLKPLILEWKKKGLAALSGHKLALTQKGRYFHTTFLLAVLEYI